MAKVQLTIHPEGAETEVPDDEVANLRAQGLIRTGDDGAELVTPAAAPPPRAATTSAARAASKE